MFVKRVLVAGAALICTAAAAQEASAQEDFAQEYFNFGQIPGVPDTPAVQLDLNPMLLGLASATTRSQNPAAADLLSSIDGVRLRIYRALEDIGDVTEFVDAVSGRLESDNWQRVVSVEDESKIRVHIRADEETVTGVTAMVIHEGDAIFVNIVGSISSQQLAESIASINAAETLASLSKIDLAD